LDESWLLTRLPLVLGPAGELIDGRGREVEGGRSVCDGNSVDGSFGEAGGGGRREPSRGMDGKRRILVGASESRLDMSCVLVGDREREFELERDPGFELGLKPAGDRLRKYGGDWVEVKVADRGRGRCGGGSNPGGGMDKSGDGGMAWIGGEFMEAATFFELIDLRYCCLKE